MTLKMIKDWEYCFSFSQLRGKTEIIYIERSGFHISRPICIAKFFYCIVTLKGAGDDFAPVKIKKELEQSF